MLIENKIDHAAFIGRLDIMKCLYKQGIYEPTLSTMNHGVVSGCIEIIEWCNEKNIKPTLLTMTIAACFGHMHIVQWCYDHNVIPILGMKKYALSYGQIKIADWIAKNVK